MRVRARKLNMGPRFTEQYQADRGWVYAKRFPDLNSRQAVAGHLPNLDDDCLSELTRNISAPASGRGLVCPAAPNSVCDVIYLRPSVEMARVNTWRVVAVMANEAATRNRTVVQLIRKPMGIGRDIFDGKSAVASHRAMPLPHPTVIRLERVRPEAFNGRAVAVSIEAFTSAKFPVSARARAYLALCDCAAVETCNLGQHN